MEIKPRDLTRAERAVLDHLLSRDFPGVEDLRTQAATVIAVGRCDCGCPSIELAQPGHPSSAKTTGPTPVEGQVDNDPPLQLLLFLDETGQLSYLELVWYGDGPPDEWPTRDKVELLRIDR